MAKKRKASSRPADQETTQAHSAGESRKRFRTFEDVADSEDEFHINQDRILLAEPADLKRARQREENEAFLQPSDEEVLDDEEDEDSDYQSINDGAVVEEAEDDNDGGEEEEEEEEAWGTSRADLYGADAIETEEQALEEEAEARRLQRKRLQSMNAADYGFDEAEWQDEVDTLESKNKRSVVKETLPALQISSSMSAADKLKMLQSKYPEFDPLRKELIKLNDVHLELMQERIEQPDDLNLQIKYQALTSYLCSLAMYFALLTAGSGMTSSPSLMPAARLRDHEIMTSLIECRETWQNVQHLRSEATQEVFLPAVEHFEKSVKRARSKLSIQQDHADKAEQKKLARAAEQLDRIEADFANLSAQISDTAATKARMLRQLRDGMNDEEEAHLTPAQAEAKAKKRKSLRFYTSQIAQKASKRSAAGRVAGGDDDVPHRERLRDRQARLNAEAEKRGHKRSDLGEELGGASDEEDAKQARLVREAVDDDGYYDMVVTKNMKKKAEKAALARAQQVAAEQGGRVVEEETVAPDGKRKITYAIEKNKGLTPHRHKDVRNPRVKKRKKYEQKTKKLASMKPTYKGGEGRGGYGGELTGIKSNLVRSVKL